MTAAVPYRILRPAWAPPSPPAAPPTSPQQSPPFCRPPRPRWELMSLPPRRAQHTRRLARPIRQTPLPVRRSPDIGPALNPRRRTYRFSTYTPAEGGGVDATPLAVWPLIELELRGKKTSVSGVTRRSD